MLFFCIETRYAYRHSFQKLFVFECAGSMRVQLLYFAHLSLCFVRWTSNPVANNCHGICVLFKSKIDTVCELILFVLSTQGSEPCSRIVILSLAFVFVKFFVSIFANDFTRDMENTLTFWWRMEAQAVLHKMRKESIRNVFLIVNFTTRLHFHKTLLNTRLVSSLYLHQLTCYSKLTSKGGLGGSSAISVVKWFVHFEAWLMS